MSKPLFFTGRKEIARENVSITLIERKGQASAFLPKLDLAQYHLPSESRVLVEAYHNAYLERFDLGTINQIKDDQPFTMMDLESGDRPHFRVKVIAASGDVEGQLLAAIDEVPPIDRKNGNSLLPLVPKKREVMGDEFWKVHFVDGEERSPELWINSDVNGLFAAFQNNDSRIVSLIMPAILRQVLLGLVESNRDSTDEVILGKWLQFAQELCPDDLPEWAEDDTEGSIQKRREWVDQVVKVFAVSHQLFDHYNEVNHSEEGAANGD